ncbi:MAG: exodeoxyribonuclease VII small subunit, partial [Candidatus Poseidonia sp.]|nr:exodeoxyribonuclease VII small subunit [Poseidonia sp.]
DEVDMRMGEAVMRRFGELRQRLMLLTTQLKHAPGKGVFRAKEQLTGLANRMNRSAELSISMQQQRLARLEATLAASHPHRVLERGYTMVQNHDGDVLTTLASLQQGQTVNLQFADGRAAADEKITYDEAVQRLEAIVAQLERGGKNLDETLAMFEEGTELLRQCQTELAEAEGRLAELRLDEAETMVAEDA